MVIEGPIDVVMPTWNSARWLARSLAAIRADASFPRGRILVVDRASSDGTREIAAAAGAEILTDTVSLGSARERGFAAATTEWVLLLDSDVEVYPGWFADVSAFGELPDAGALQPTPVPPWMRRERVLRAYRGRVFPKGSPERLPSGGRGYTYSTLVRRELVAGLALAKFEAYEDKAISDEVQRRGKAWWIVPVFPTHHVTIAENGRKARWNAAGRRNAGLFRAGREALTTAGSVKDGIVDSVRFGDARFVANAAVVAANAWRGYLRPHKYRRRHPGDR